MMLSIQNLHAAVKDVEILKGIDLEIKAGEVHAIMGPNGSGKSTLAHVLAGKENYEITEGTILFQGQPMLAVPPETRAQMGLFLGFQYPIEIPGVSNIQFLKTAYNSIRKSKSEHPLDAIDFLQIVKNRMKQLEMDEDFIYRSLNEGFSGGEKKRNEILQMLVLEPRLALLDETDSGLDIDALQIVAKGVNAFRRGDRAILLITHYQRLLDYIVPDYVHVLSDGKIVKTGDPYLAKMLEKRGYAWLAA